MATTLLYTIFTTFNFFENEALPCGRRALLKGDVKPLDRQELDSNVLKSPLHDGHIIHVSKLVLTRR